MRTKAAYVSKIIKAELKDKFPGIAFSVRSETYSGGNSVNIDYTKSKISPKVGDVNTIVKKYQAGHFDGMTDCYEYTNKTAGPTVMFVSVQENYPKAVHEAVRAMNLGSASPETYQLAYESKMLELAL